MKFSSCVTSLLAFIWLSSFCGATASLDCTFKDGFCDWKQTVKQCSWKRTTNCLSNAPGCVFVTNNSGANCSSVGLTADIGSRGNRVICFEYFISGHVGGSLQVKDSVGNILWSRSHSQGPDWRPAQIPLQNEEYAKAIILEAHFDPGSQKFIAVKFVLEVEKIKACTNPADSTTAAIHTSSLSTMQDFSDSPTTTSLTAWSTGTEIQTTMEASKTTSQAEENTPTHAQTEVNQLTETHSTTPSETDSSTSSTNQFVSVKPVTVFPSPTPKINEVMSETDITSLIFGDGKLLVGIVTGIIGFILLLVIVTTLTARRFRRNTSSPHTSTSLRMDPTFTAE